MNFPRNFRKMTPSDRRQWLADSVGQPDLLDAPTASAHYLNMADTLVENSVGIVGIPLGVACGFMIDGKEYAIPLATEEPSVIAAASFAATIIAHGGGFVTSATDPIMECTVYVENADAQMRQHIESMRDELEFGLVKLLHSMSRRGGGFRSLDILEMSSIPMLKIVCAIDVRDAMGANLLNTCAESIAGKLSNTLGINPVMGILTNNAGQRRARAECRLSASRAAMLCRGMFSGGECMRRFELASMIAHHDKDRAVTHNKGIMNGISALALATLNDTRAVEAAAHAWAQRDGAYRGLSVFAPDGDALVCSLDMPLPFATIGGSTGTHPTAQFCLDLLHNPSSPHLARIAASVGLAQNIAAVAALISTGIQKGHMPLHHKKNRTAKE
ncbi:MAG: hydroxymethylglutaryl-CoA reductase, degradative [Chitinivibrionales bacterium]|nr:hydroxymethylglutaryl-CoA reductase, degradative [Chitinivibrionales bacterium]